MESDHYVYEEEPGKFRIYPTVCNIEQVHFFGDLEACQRFKDALEKFTKSKEDE